MGPVVHVVEMLEQREIDHVAKASRSRYSSKDYFASVTKLANGTIGGYLCRRELFPTRQEFWCLLMVHVGVETGSVSETAIAEHVPSRRALLQPRTPQLHKSLLRDSSEVSPSVFV